jgi:iron complex outermembrane recepter protein
LFKNRNGTSAKSQFPKRSLGFLSTCCCVTCWLTLSGTATAQQATNNSMSQAPSQPESIDEIIVTARKRTENLQDTPITVTAVTGDQLQERALHEVNELANLVPGMTMYQNQAAPLSVIFNIRAQSQNDLIVALDPPIGVYSDGVFLNSAIGVLASSLTDLDRVEILEGPQGTLYGRNTTGGAVNFYTKPPTDKWGGELTAEAGSFDEHDISGVLNAPISDKASLRIVGEQKGDDGYGRNVTTGQGVADLKSRMVRATLKLTPIDNFTALLRADYSDAQTDGGILYVPLMLNPTSLAAKQIALSQGFLTSAQLTAQGNVLTSAQQTSALNYYNGFVHLPGTPFAAAYGSPNNAGVHAWGTSATLEYNIGPVQLKSISALRDINDQKSEDIDAIPVNIYSLDPFKTRIHQVTQEVQANGDAFANKFHYTSGVFYIYSQGLDLNYSYSTPLVVPTTPSYTNATVTVKSPAVYSQATYDILPTLHLTGGLRYTHEERTLVAANKAGPTQSICSVPPPAGVGGMPCVGTFPFEEGNVSHTAGLDWNVTQDVMAYVKSSTGFKSGGVNERLTANPASATPFKAEDVTDYETGAKSEWFSHRLRLNADYYYDNYTNIQRTVLALDPTGRAISLIQNAAKATIDGVEAQLTAIPIDHLTFQGGMAYTHPKYERYISPATGTDLSSQAFSQVSKWSYTVSEQYLVPMFFGDVSERLDWDWRSSANLFPVGTITSLDVQPAYGTLNGVLQATLQDSQVDIRLFAKNLLDKTYFQTIFDLYSSIGVVSGSPGAPRTWGVSVTKRF